MRRAGVLPGLLLALAAAGSEGQEGEAVAPLRLATCAALWEGYADVLGDKGERALARRFRDAAARLSGDAEADAMIAERRPWMADLMVAYIHERDDQSRDLFERLVTGCGPLEADLP